MRPRVRPIFAYVLGIAFLSSGCGARPDRDQTTTGPPLPEPVIPAGYQKVAPAPADDSVQMLRQTAAIFRGTLKNVKFTYDGCGGPRTTYVFSDASSLAGVQVQPDIALKVLGGPTPSGSWVSVSELPQLALDSQYVTFVRNTDWTYSPVVGNLVFRVETIAGREMLVHPSGHAVTGWNDEGPVLSAAAVSGMVGRELRGTKGRDAPQVIEPSSSASTDPQGEVRPTGGANAAPGHDPASVLTRAPSLADARSAGLFAKPRVLESAIANEPTVAVEAFVATVRRAADAARVEFGGRLTLDPYWRCWSSTPTARARR